MALTFNSELFSTEVVPATIDSQKAVADKVLTILSEVDPNAIVAGGAPREWQMGKLAKDIDCYFDAAMKDFIPADLEGLFLKHGIEISKIKSGKNISKEYTGNPDLYYVIDCFIDGEIVQLMGMTSSVDKCVVDKFPVSISQIWYKDGKTFATKLFDIGWANRMIFRCGEEYSSKVPYMQKIKDKFSDWECVGF